MSTKVDAWVVVRLDGPVKDLSDYLSIKGVYDTQAAAEKAADASKIAGRADYARYQVLRTRRMVDEDAQKGAQKREPRIQGLPSKSLEAQTWYAIQSWQDLQSVLGPMPLSDRWKTAQPYLGFLSEALVARALHGVIVSGKEPGGPDVLLPNGETVEVKTVRLDPEQHRTAIVEFRKDAFDFLALVLFQPDLSAASARLIPATVIRHFEQPSSQTRQGQRTMIRVTPDLLTAPGTLRIELGGGD